MAKTLLNGVNEVMKALKLIQGDSGTLTTLSDSPRQTHIDLIVQKWNEATEYLYSAVGRSWPNELAENTITLATSDRDYALQTDLVQLRWPFLDETNGQYIFEWEAGYENLVAVQSIPANWTGLPLHGCIRPTDGELYLDRIPTSAENGRVYKYRYDKDISVSAAADTFPFDDIVFRAMVPAVTQLYRRERESQSDDAVMKASFGRAARYLTKTAPRTHW